MAFANPVWFLFGLALITPVNALQNSFAAQSDQYPNNGVDTVTVQVELSSAEGPVSGATVVVFDDNGLRAETVSQESGKFRVEFKANDSAKTILVIASGKLIEIRTIDRLTDSPLKIVLQHEAKPLSGRIIDNQGMGVANANLRFKSLRQDKLTLEIPADLNNGQFNAITNENGMFQFAGIDSSMVGQILVTASGCADAFISSANFQDEIVLVVQPGRTVKGKVFDRVSKRHISNVTISSSAGQQTEVNEAGAFQLKGVAAFQPVQLTAKPTGEQPYLLKSERLPVEQGFDPSVIEIGLQPGVWVNCKVKDFGTEGPAAAEVYYFPTPENDDFQSFVDSFLAGGTVESISTNASGDASIVAIPGPGAIAIVAPGFPPNKSVSQLTEEQRVMFQAITRRNDLTAVALIDPDDLKDELNLNFVVSQGRAIDVELTDQRLSSTDQIVVHRAASKTSYAKRIVGTKFVADQFQPGETRQLLIHAVDKRLGAVMNVAAETKSPVKIGLEPTGSVLGQIVDKLGDPQPGLSVEFETESTDGYQQIAMSAFTDANGRFEQPSLIATLEYRITAVRLSNKEQMKSGAPMMDSRWPVADKLKLSSNESVDLGTIVLGADEQPKPSRRPRKTVITDSNLLPPLISGRLTNYAAEPIADAVILFKTWPDRSGDLKSDSELMPQVLSQARSDSNGSFQMTIDKSLKEKLIGSDTKDGNPNAAIIVLAEKLGVMQIPLQSIANPQDLKIQMVREMIVRGNLVTPSEVGAARLVPGRRMDIYGSDSIKQIIAALRSGKSLAAAREEFQPISTVDPLAAGLSLTWKTSSTGAFLVRNIPINAIFELHAIGESGRRQTITVINRPLRGFEFKPFDDSAETMQLQGSRIKIDLGSVDFTKQ